MRESYSHRHEELCCRLVHHHRHHGISWNFLHVSSTSVMHCGRMRPTSVVGREESILAECQRRIELLYEVGWGQETTRWYVAFPLDGRPACHGGLVFT